MFTLYMIAIIGEGVIVADAKLLEAHGLEKPYNEICLIKETDLLL